MEEYKIVLNEQETQKSLKTLSRKILRILHVYEESQIKEEYDYKTYVSAIIMYVASLNGLTNYDLTDIIINLNAILINDLDKAQIKKIVFECKNISDNTCKKMGDTNGNNL